MKALAVLNGFSVSFAERAAETAAFLKERLEGLETDRAVIFWNGQGDGEALAAGLPVRRVTLVALRAYQPETVLALLPQLCGPADGLLFPADCFGAEIAVRLAVRLKGSALTEVTRAKGLALGALLAEKKVYSQHLRAAFELRRRPFCLTLAREADVQAGAAAGRPEVDYLEPAAPWPAFVLSAELTPAPPPPGLLQARRLVVAGQGLGGPEAVAAAAGLAEGLGAEFGVSRPVAMNAWAPLNRLIGVSGALTKPEGALTLGVSGAPAFYAGLEKSGQIISVNHDPQAPIIARSDVALIDDCRAVTKELGRLLGSDSHWHKKNTSNAGGG